MQKYFAQAIDNTSGTSDSVSVPNTVLGPSLTGNSTTNEGATYTLNLDPNGFTAINQWTINWGDRSALENVTSSLPIDIPHVYADGPNTFTISTTANSGAYTANTLIVNVQNVAPYLAASGATIVNEGATYTLNLTSSDPGDDTILRWTIDWGDGNVQYILDNPSTATHVYADGPSTHSIIATATDEDGTYDTCGMAAGELDPTFSDDGQVLTNISIDGADYTPPMAIQSDGKIVIASSLNGDFILARYDADGNPDDTFGVNGIVTTDFGGGDYAYAVAIQADGKIIVAGTSGSDFALARYNSDHGSLDTTFDDDGMQTTDIFQDDASAYAISVQPDGFIVLGGYCYDSGNSETEFALVRYEPDGDLDVTFDEDGIVTTYFGSVGYGNYDYVYAMALQSDGKIVAAGYGQNDGYHYMASARYETDGNLDLTFGNNGLITDLSEYNSWADAWANAIAIQSDGKIVVAGGGFGLDQSYYYQSNDFALIRYNIDGSRDTTFDGDGLAIWNRGEFSDDFLYGVAIQSDGKIIAAGYSDGTTLVRYNPDGSLDTTFGDDGVRTFDLSGYLGVAFALQVDGKILMDVSENNNCALARVFPGVIVQNVAPTLTVVDNKTVNEGHSLNITDLGTFTDPGFDNPFADTATSEDFTYQIDWGDGTDVDTGTAAIQTPGAAGVLTHGSFDGDHTYAEEGVYTVTVTLSDEDGGQDVTTFQVTVNNAVPSMTVAPFLTFDAAEALRLVGSGSITDSEADRWTATIDYGDESNLQSITDNGAYQGDYRYHAAGSGENIATWTFDGLDPEKNYEVFTTWVAGDDRATNAPFSIFDNTTLLTEDPVLKYQINAPDGLTIDSRPWESLGVYQFTSGKLVVQLSDDADGCVIADAIRIAEVPPGTQAPRVIDDGEAAYAESGSDWEFNVEAKNFAFDHSYSGEGPYTVVMTVTDGQAASSTVFFDVSGTWPDTLEVEKIDIDNDCTLLLDPASSINSTITIDDPISGYGGLAVNSLGTLTLSSDDNTYSGLTEVNYGTLNVTGSITGDISVGDGAELSGDGTIAGDVFIGSGGTISPGDDTTTNLLTTGNLKIISGSALSAPSSTYSVQINSGTPILGYDQIQVNGTVTLSNAYLDLSGSITPSDGTVIVLIKNDDNDAVRGTFHNLLEGDMISSFGSYLCYITYHYNAETPTPEFETGNDVALFFNSTFNETPTVGSPAPSATLHPSGKTASLSARGADNYTDESNLTYTWEWDPAFPSTGTVAPTFSVNGTNDARDTVATFSILGSYRFKVTITDPCGLST